MQGRREPIASFFLHQTVSIVYIYDNYSGCNCFTESTLLEHVNRSCRSSSTAVASTPPAEHLHYQDGVFKAIREKNVDLMMPWWHWQIIVYLYPFFLPLVIHWSFQLLPHSLRVSCKIEATPSQGLVSTYRKPTVHHTLSTLLCPHTKDLHCNHGSAQSAR